MTARVTFAAVFLVVVCVLAWLVLGSLGDVAAVLG